MSKKSKKAKKAKLENGDTANPFLLRGRDVAARQETFSHPWNPNSEIMGVQLGRALGLKRTGVSIARIPPGKESFAPHAHQREEEWLYILMGQGLATVGPQEVAVGAGDFLAFPAPQVTHHLKNVGDEDLVYLMGGENRDSDVVAFPTLGKTMVRANGDVTIFETASGKPFAPRKLKKKSKKDT